MTELEELKKWLARVNLPYTVAEYVTFEDHVSFGNIVTHDRCTTITLSDDVKWTVDPKTTSTYVAGDESKAEGYSYFWHVFTFDSTGALIKSGTWE